MCSLDHLPLNRNINTLFNAKISSDTFEPHTRYILQVSFLWLLFSAIFLKLAWMKWIIHIILSRQTWRPSVEKHPQMTQRRHVASSPPQNEASQSRDSRSSCSCAYGAHFWISCRRSHHLLVPVGFTLRLAALWNPLKSTQMGFCFFLSILVNSATCTVWADMCAKRVPTGSHQPVRAGMVLHF